MHTLPPPLGLMGAVGADLRGRPEEDSACEEGAGVGSGTRVWGTAGPRGTETQAGTGIPGVWDGDAGPEPGLRDPGMETQVWDWVLEMGWEYRTWTGGTGDRNSGLWIGGELMDGDPCPGLGEQEAGAGENGDRA